MKGREATERRFDRQIEAMSIKADVSITRLEDLFKPDPTIRYNLNNKVFQASAHTMDRVDSKIMNNITRSYNEGLGIDEAKDRLTVEYSGLKSWEAQRIARTEINSAQNDGAYDVISSGGPLRTKGSGRLLRQTTGRCTERLSRSERHSATA